MPGIEGQMKQAIWDGDLLTVKKLIDSGVSPDLEIEAGDLRWLWHFDLVKTPSSSCYFKLARIIIAEISLLLKP